MEEAPLPHEQVIPVILHGLDPQPAPPEPALLRSCVDEAPLPRKSPLYVCIMRGRCAGACSPAAAVLLVRGAPAARIGEDERGTLVQILSDTP